MKRHQIRLRGPWQIFCEKKGGSEQFRTTLPTEIGKIRQLLGDQNFAQVSTKLVFKRAFHSPTNLTPDDRISLLVMESALSGQISLNEEQPIEFAAQVELEITETLKPHNQILIEFPAQQFNQLPDESLIWEEVILCIDSTN